MSEYRQETEYAALSENYDALMTDARYPQRAAALARRLGQAAIPVHTVLDLGSGTGQIAWRLARRGFRVLAVDASEEMLTAAARRADDRPFRRTAPPLFLHQSMEALDLGTTVDAAVSTLDALNYLTAGRALRETFRRVYRSLAPGGVFLFDVNTPYKLRGMDRQVNYEERPGVVCVWRTFFRPARRECVWQVDLFRARPDGSWERRQEEHRERAWSAEELRRALERAGFRNVTFTGDLSGDPPAPDTLRWNVSAEKPQ